MRRIGRGGEGEVWSAIDQEAGEAVAVKTPPRGAEPTVHHRVNLRREAAFLRILRHPNIVGFRDADTSAHQERPYLVTDLIQGSTLAHARRRRGAMPLPQVVNLGAQLTDALAAVHDKGVTHHDIKPDNVMTTTDGVVKIIDFGTARLTPGPSPSTLVTTLGYLSPEVAAAYRAMKESRAKPAPLQVAPSLDIHAAGLVLYEAATGRRAFPAGLEGLDEQVRGQVPRLKHEVANIPRALDELVADMTAANPADRPTAGEAFSRLRAIRANVSESTKAAQTVSRSVDPLKAPMASRTWKSPRAPVSDAAGRPAKNSNTARRSLAAKRASQAPPSPRTNSENAPHLGPSLEK